MTELEMSCARREFVLKERSQTKKEIIWLKGMSRLALVLAAVFVLSAVFAVQTKAQSLTGQEITSPTMMYAVKKVNIRKEPDTSAEQMGQLEEGEKIFAVKLTEEGWYQVTYEGETGYIRKDFLAVYKVEGEWDEPSDEDMTENGQAPEGQESQEAEEPDSESQEAEEPDSESQDPEQDPESPTSEGSEQNGDSQEAQSGQSGISNIIIIIFVIVIILVYAVIQIAKERKGGSSINEDGREREQEAEGAGEEVTGKVAERKAEEKVTAEKKAERRDVPDSRVEEKDSGDDSDLVILDLDAEDEESQR